MRPQETPGEHADRLAREQPQTSLSRDASPDERGEVLVEVLALAEALRRSGPRERSRAMSVHEVVRRGGA